GTHLVIHRNTFGHLRNLVTNLAREILDNRPVQAWLVCEDIEAEIKHLEMNGHRALPTVEEYDESHTKE
ncbi:MAG: hypothetical protein MJA29_00275, partial [Candidatus Omnitrophica bacterium]|nr:hypothetical protein [Candidatus Omnitrophota bacterium]